MVAVMIACYLGSKLHINLQFSKPAAQQQACFGGDVKPELRYRKNDHTKQHLYSQSQQSIAAGGDAIKKVDYFDKILSIILFFRNKDNIFSRGGIL